eukprot:TRINITY_DN556_c5_g1_i1.p1 TRINITY_DN556_c5_g1~~TRINITY_DN556_c5_g1_i1.p1  ORF type:complete len:443 (+),score=71.65 TRINITY_DN556_c5_g1_i1:462-1790(+)
MTEWSFEIDFDKIENEVHVETIKKIQKKNLKKSIKLYNQPNDYNKRLKLYKEDIIIGKLIKGEIAGVYSIVRKKLEINNTKIELAYFFDAVVSQKFRNIGIFTKLHENTESYYDTLNKNPYYCCKMNNKNRIMIEIWYDAGGVYFLHSDIIYHIWDGRKYFTCPKQIDGNNENDDEIIDFDTTRQQFINNYKDDIKQLVFDYFDKKKHSITDFIVDVVRLTEDKDSVKEIWKNNFSTYSLFQHSPDVIYDLSYFSDCFKIIIKFKQANREFEIFSTISVWNSQGISPMKENITNNDDTNPTVKYYALFATTNSFNIYNSALTSFNISHVDRLKLSQILQEYIILYISNYSQYKKSYYVTLSTKNMPDEPLNLLFSTLVSNHEKSFLDSYWALDYSYRFSSRVNKDFHFTHSPLVNNPIFFDPRDLGAFTLYEKKPFKILSNL